MRLLVVEPGSTYSTTDVCSGLASGLTGLGHEVIMYDSRRHIYFESMWLRQLMESADMGDECPPRGITPDEYRDLPHHLAQAYSDYNYALKFNAFRDVYVTARELLVDAVVIISGHLMPDAILSMLSVRDDTPHGRGTTPTYVVFTESPYEDERQLRQSRLVDGAFVNDANSVEKIDRGSYLPMGYNPDRHYQDGTERTRDVVFVGVGYRERIELLEGVDWSGISLELYGDWRLVSDDSPIRRFIREGVIDNSVATQLYREARVGLNLYRTCTDHWNDNGHHVTGWSLNPRAYELAACGTPQVSQWRGEWPSVFGDADVSLLTFSSSSGLERGIRAILGSKEYADKVASRQHAAVAGHSYRDRAAALADRMERENRHALS